jgi:hypothetical protein
MTGTTTYIGSATKDGKGNNVKHHPGIIDFVKDQGTYSLDYNKRDASFDADNDGMADAWEKANGGDLEPNDYTLDPKGWYTNLEVYCNSLVEDIMQAGNADALTPVNEYYPSCTKVNVNADDDQPDDPSTGTDGSIVWAFNTGAAGTPTIMSSINSGIASTSVTLGSELKYDGTQNVTGLGAATKIQQTNVDATQTASTANAITFSLTTATGYKFQATSVEFSASRIGTDKGKMDVKWTDQGGTVALASAVTPNRNGTAPHYTNYTYNVTKATATEGTCSLVINLYDLSFVKDGANTYKDYAFANIVINGVLTSSTGISTPVTLTPIGDGITYNLQGQRVDASYKGIVIRNGKKFVQR